MRNGNETANCANYNLLKENSKRLKEKPTNAEAVLWNYLKSDSMGVRFRRQHIIDDYIVDFVCLKCRLVIEIDGGYHGLLEQMEDDEIRTKQLEYLGFEVMRFTNEEVLKEPEKVLSQIKTKLFSKKSPTLKPHPGPPRTGRG